jgi:hypothetical protein
MSLLKGISQTPSLKQLHDELIDNLIDFGRRSLEIGRREGDKMKEGWAQENLANVAEAEEEIKQR